MRSHCLNPSRGGPARLRPSGVALSSEQGGHRLYLPRRARQLSVRISSTRRFDWRPEALSLLVTGKLSPLPIAVI